jgi:hypothetical protein
MTWSYVRAFGVIAFLSLAGACKDGEIPIGQNAQPISCQSNSDCPSGTPCVNGTCHIGNTGAGGAQQGDVGGGPANGEGGAQQGCVGGGPANGEGGAQQIGVGGGETGAGGAQMGAGGSNAGAGGASLACSSNADCLPGQLCKNGVCTP